MPRRYSRKPSEHIDIAKERIVILMDKADEIFSKNKSLANRYVTLARKIAMKFKVRIPSILKRRFCPNCYRFLRPGVNLRVRLTKQKLVYLCLECRHFWRMPYISEIKKRRKTRRAKGDSREI